MTKKIAVFTGAGISKESGIATFRDSKEGLWENFKVEDVATIEGWYKDKGKVLEFYNARRRELPNVEPNQAHRALALLENEYDVTIVTQNVDDLHERGGSSLIYHLHGELTKARTSKKVLDKHELLMGKTITPFEIGYNDINLGDECPTYEGQVRPHIVWFGEMPFNVPRAYQAIEQADILLIVGTSLQISYTLDLLRAVKSDCDIYYIDPKPMRYLDNYGLKVNYIEKNAVEGVTEIVDQLIIQAIGSDKNDK